MALEFWVAKQRKWQLGYAHLCLRVALFDSYPCESQMLFHLEHTPGLTHRTAGSETGLGWGWELALLATTHGATVMLMVLTQDHTLRTNKADTITLCG